MDSSGSIKGYIQRMTNPTTSPEVASWRLEKGFTNFEMLLVFLVVVLTIAILIPAYLASNRVAAEREIGIRLAVIQEAKRDVIKEMNLILPRESRLRITDPVNPVHLDKITRINLESPWRFQPESPDPLGGMLSVGETFLEPPSSSLGIPIANLDTLLTPEPKKETEE